MRIKIKAKGGRGEITGPRGSIWGKREDMTVNANKEEGMHTQEEGEGRKVGLEGR